MRSCLPADILSLVVEQKHLNFATDLFFSSRLFPHSQHVCLAASALRGPGHIWISRTGSRSGNELDFLWTHSSRARLSVADLLSLSCTRPGRIKTVSRAAAAAETRTKARTRPCGASSGRFLRMGPPGSCGYSAGATQPPSSLPDSRPPVDACARLAAAPHPPTSVREDAALSPETAAAKPGRDSAGKGVFVAAAAVQRRGRMPRLARAASQWPSCLPHGAKLAKLSGLATASGGRK